MATLDDLFGGSGEKKAKVANLKNVGDTISGVITEIDTEAPVFEWDTANNKVGFQKFWVDSKPKGVPKDEAQRSGLQPVKQIMVSIKTAEGEDARIPFNSKDERAALKTAVGDAGGQINVGDTIGKKLIKREGNIKTHAVKLVPAS